jgi:hypothetical protein
MQLLFAFMWAIWKERKNHTYDGVGKSSVEIKYVFLCSLHERTSFFWGGGGGGGGGWSCDSFVDFVDLLNLRFSFFRGFSCTPHVYMSFFLLLIKFLIAH